MGNPDDELSSNVKTSDSSEIEVQDQTINPLDWDIAADNEGKYPPVDSTSILYRRVTNKKGLNPRNVVLRGAFLRRGPTSPPESKLRDTNGLSINVASGRSHDQVLTDEFNARTDCCAVCTLIASEVRSIRVPGTDVHLEVVLSSPTHGNIKRLPPGSTNGPYPEVAEKLATELAKRASVIERSTHRMR